MSADLFDWNARATWLAEVPDYARSILTDRVQAKIARSRPECWSDNFAWLPVIDGENKFSAAFTWYYQHIRAFHGCRPTNFQSYFLHGLQCQSAEFIENQFLKIFEDVSVAATSQVVTEFRDRKRAERGRFWVVLDEHELIERCGHYLIQGSEYLMALAATLCRLAPPEDYRLRLRSSGTPTIFELHIPTSQFPEHQVEALSRLVLSAWGEQVARRPLGMSHSPCLTVHQTIEPKNLVGHRHPTCIRDPHFGYVYFVNEKTVCSHCAI